MCLPGGLMLQGNVCADNLGHGFAWCVEQQEDQHGHWWWGEGMDRNEAGGGARLHIIQGLLGVAAPWVSVLSVITLSQQSYRVINEEPQTPCRRLRQLPWRGQWLGLVGYRWS